MHIYATFHLLTYQHQIKPRKQKIISNQYSRPSLMMDSQHGDITGILDGKMMVHCSRPILESTAGAM
jgi:hypothetical protein